MGFTISSTVNIGRPLFAGAYSLGNIIAFSKANIDKSLLDNWLNLTELQGKYPTRIHVQGTTVSFDGPVAIIKSVKALKVSLSALVCLATAFLTYYASKALLTALANRKVCLCADFDKDKIQKISLAFAAVSGLAAGGLFYASSIFNMKPGVYFLN